MKIFDAHVHFSRIRSFEDCAQRTSFVDYSKQGYIFQAAANNVVGSVCMGLSETTPEAFPDSGVRTPMQADMEPTLPDGMALCPGINPHRLGGRSLTITEEQIKTEPHIVGLKIYAGYYHVDITDPIYDPVYKLAEKYDLAIVIHTGETYSERGLLKYAHPLRVDDLAVAHPKLRIVACHMGVPWVFDACEVAAKNPNVYFDLSGMLVGDSSYIERQSKNPLLIDRYRQALAYMDNFDKILYGSDWPLVPMSAYIAFCKQLVPEGEHEKVFYSNALKVFKLAEQ